MHNLPILWSGRTPRRQPRLGHAGRRLSWKGLLLALSLVALGGWGAAAKMAQAAASPDTGKASPPEPKRVKVLTKRKDGVTHFYVQNNEYCEITMTFEPCLKHLNCSQPLPYTATFPARKTTEAFTLTPTAPGVKWEYSYTNYYKLGSSLAQPDDTLYQLPYKPGASYLVTQGYNGKFSHSGSNQYATDWDLPEGTPVYAARGGIVVRTKDDSTKGGPSMKFDHYNNYVLIRHDDGTLGHYCHLKKGGIVVKVGQVVKAGDLLALSGNTGFSSGAHLHFCVFKTIDGHKRKSIPVRFRTAKYPSVTLVSGQRYQAVALATTPAATQTAAAAGRPAPGSPAKSHS